MNRKQSESYEAKVLEFFTSRPGQSFKSRELALKLEVPNREYQNFKKWMRDLEQGGRIARYKGNRYGMPRKAETVSGVLDVKTQGYGFLKRDDGGEDIFISEKNMGAAMHRDRVKVTLWAQAEGRLPEGRVVEILDRAHERIVGLYQEEGSRAYVVPDNLKINRDILIPEKRKNAKPGQKVVAEITRWENTRRMPEGRIVEVLGFPEERGVDMLSVIHSYDLPGPFPGDVLEESGRIDPAALHAGLKDRLDLRRKITFTIDPKDAKDFDDAVSLEPLKGGRLLLGVHIADVSAFVKAGSALDREAAKRGTSIYLADRTIPMLPERLSGDLCSLRPGEDRLTYSVMMEIENGSLASYRISPSVIRSNRRLTYEEAQKLIDGHRKKHSRGETKKPAAGGKASWTLEETLCRMAELAAELKRKWRAQGSLDFNAPEVEIEYDAKGKVAGLSCKKRLETHELIEALMLLANQTVAGHALSLSKETGRKLPFVFRIHEPPAGKNLEAFMLFVKTLGYSFEPGKRPNPLKFQALLKQVKGSRHEFLVEETMLRAMMKAVYSTRNAGHFGLAFDHYTHFTSPIRRYPDLIVHRLLKMYATAKADVHPLAGRLSQICEVSTEREIVAQEAERESIRAKQVEYMQDRIGEEYDGIISGVTNFGFFAEIPEILVEGLVHIRNLTDDYYRWDDRHHALIGENTGKRYRLGDAVRIRVERVLREMRKIDFSLVSEEKHKKKY